MAHNYRPTKIRKQSLWFLLGKFDGAPKAATADLANTVLRVAEERHMEYWHTAAQG